MYTWKSGYHGSVAAELAGSELERIRMANQGKLAPVAVVDAARPADHVLHRAFEWDDALAAEEFRLVQARAMIRSVVIRNEQTPDVPSVRAFIVVTDTAEEGDSPRQIYVSTLAAMAEPLQRAEILRRAAGELESFRRKYALFEELAEVLAAAEAFNVRVTAKPELGAQRYVAAINKSEQQQAAG